MLRFTGALLIGFLLALSGCSENNERPKRTSLHDWKESFPEAVQLSASTGKPIFAFFTGSNWCGYCKALSAEILETDAFAEWAEENLIMLELDFPTNYEQTAEIKDQNKQLAKMYAVQGYPTIIVMDSNGRPIIQLGYEKVTPADYIAKIDSAIKKSQVH